MSLSDLTAALRGGGPLHGLAEFSQFILYKLITRNDRSGKVDKLPVDHRTGQIMPKGADWQKDPTYWTDAENALTIAGLLGADYGVGFLFTDFDPFVFIDLDSCLMDNGQWSLAATELCGRLQGAAVEISQSGRGLHIIGTANSVPAHGCKNAVHGLEMYHSGRFVALTGLGAVGNVMTDITGQLPALVADYFSPASGSGDRPAEWTTTARPEYTGPQDDDQLIDLMLKQRANAGQVFGGKASFAELWRGDVQALSRAYPDHYGNRPYDSSSADAGLASHLGFWTGGNCERILGLMWRSGLVRPKWSEHDSYLTRTITSAVSRCDEVYSAGNGSRSWLTDDVELDGHPDLSQDALARELSTAANFTNDARYVPAWNSWLFWRDGRWEIDQKLHHMTAVRGFLQKKANGLIEWAVKHSESLESKDAEKIVNYARSNAKALRQAGNVNAVETLARSNADLVATVDQFDADLMLLGTPGGTVDLRTGELTPAQREHYLTKQVAVTPAASGTPAPRWSAFMERIFNGDRELIDFMQRVAGYALTGSTAEHKLIFAYGTGSNGKSVFINTLFGIMADYARRAPAQTFLDSVSDRHPTDLAGLHGARLVVGSELPPGKAWNESVVKDLTGGDVITARKMRQDFFEYKPQFTLLIAGNHQPSFRGIDEAIRRRVVLVPFTQTIPVEERDLGLEEKLKAEWPAILRWMVDGAVMWGSHGLMVPQTVQTASDEYLDFEDTLGDFIRENLTESIGSKVATVEIYDRFTVWQRQNGITQAWTKKAMTQALRERGLSTAKLTGGARGFRDVALKCHSQQLPSSNGVAAAVFGQSGT